MYNFYTIKWYKAQPYANNFLRIMKLTVIILIAAFMQVSANTYGQITLKGKNIKIETVLDEISNQTGYFFIFTKAQLKAAKPVTVDLKNVSIQNALDNLFTGQPFSYDIDGKDINIYKKSFVESSIEAIQAYFDKIDITGRVVNEKGEPLIGATVSIKGTTISMKTNNDGDFFLSNVDERSKIVISFIGYDWREFSVSKNLGKLILIESSSKLEEVSINAGYYRVSEKEKTGSISRVSSETISKQPISNPLASLIGRMAGVVITQQSGLPGGAFSVQIRGRNSIASGNDPLYILNGVPFNSTSLATSLGDLVSRGASPLNSINPNDIESIEVLKDADATAIYGSRGANGVVLITTKKGISGSTNLDVNYYRGIGSVAHFMSLLNTEEFLTMRKEAFANDNRVPTVANAPDQLIWDKNRNIDWQKEFIGGTVNTNNLQASLSGGTSATTFLLNGGYFSEGTVFPGDFGEKKGNASINLNHQSIDKKLNINFSSQYSYIDDKLSSSDVTNLSLTLAPNRPNLFNQDGSLNILSIGGNPYLDLYRKYNATTKNLSSNILISYKLINGLEFKISGGYNDVLRSEIRTIPSTTISPTSTTLPSSSFGTSKINTWITEPQINFSRKVGEGNLSALIGGTLQESIRADQVIDAGGYTNDIMLENIQAAASLSILSNTHSQYLYSALFGRLNYNLLQKYILNFTMRRDGSSRFGPGKQFANFSSLGMAYVFSQENFISENFSFLTFGKLRASYGSSGNDQIGDYQYLELWNPTTFPYGGVSGLVINRIANDDYAWEVNRKLEIGLDLGLINNRITTTIGYYSNRSTNQLVGYSLPSSTGAFSVQSNLPALVQNKGFEMELNTLNINKRNFKWETSFNITFPKNTLLDFPDIESSGYGNLYTVGKSLSTVKKFHSLGVDPTTGLLIFEDLDGDGTGRSYPGDLQSRIDLNPKFYGGLNNTLKYRGLQLDVFAQFVKQLGYSYRISFGVPGTTVNQAKDVLNRWQKPGDLTSIQKFTTQAGRPAYTAFITDGDHYFTDASFIRVKNIMLSYYIPTSMSTKIGLKKTKVYFQAQNAFTITNYIGLDPENQNNKSVPPLRVYAFGINFSL
ncbi:SusC/RagA family TonB-linked outer membrane protein [Pedobacter metabolipauper]|uniref:TonB-linked SusC/RagA family outer membrane protein n=1 Tax=Pedobacter metabolipauper TaxID=425513 RepID=A0A4R6SU30_9SPHI|nr:SusC/RagA family TonB-linked outer membrane protein [Pedobacter metabolipauper]TDQ08476.1 TonB-linked SusC/RagA family outer membrane protein [Pedobacter metabolipauper]